MAQSGLGDLGLPSKHRVRRLGKRLVAASEPDPADYDVLAEVLSGYRKVLEHVLV